MRHDRWELLFALAEEQHGAFTTAQATELGIDSASLGRARRDRLIDTVRPTVHAVMTLLDDWTPVAAVQLAQSRAIAGHRAAAVLHRFDGIETFAMDLLVPRNVWLRGPTVFRVSDLVVPEIVTIDGIRCTDEIRTLSDLGRVVDDAALERAVESYLRRPGSSEARLRERAEALARPGKSGPRALLRVLDGRPDIPTESDLETMYWQGLRAHGVDLPVRQHPVGRFRLDLAYVPERVFVELDGWGAHGSRAAFGADRRRQNEVVLDGWVPLRFTHSDVTMYMPRTARITETMLRRRRAQLVVPRAV